MTPTRQHYLLQSNLKSTKSEGTSIRVSSSASGEIPTSAKKKKKTLKDFREEGGILSFNTPVGALNPFGIYYGLVSIFLGIPWFFALKTCQFMYWITGGRFDKKVCWSRRVAC